MAIETFPLFNLPWFSYEIVVDTETYVFEYRYSERAESWYLDIFDVDQTPVRTGIRIVTGWQLNLRDLDLFEGTLMCVRLDDKGDADPTENDFPSEVAIVYFTGDDLLNENPPTTLAPVVSVEAAP